MTTQQTPSDSNTSSGLERFVPYELQVGYGMAVAWVLSWGISVANLILYRDKSLAVLVWGILLTTFLGIMTLYSFVTINPQKPLLSRAERLRWIFLMTAGGVGALTALLGLILPFCTTPMAQTNYPEIFMGGPKAWRSNGWAVGRCVGALIGGLVLMFVGLQLARSVQRTSMSMRRWLYGYNAILSGLLLLFILILINLLPYTGVKPFSYAMEASDWTAAQMYTIQPATKNLLAELKEPFKVYVLIPSGSLLSRDIDTLMNSCRGVNPLFSWEQLSRDRNRNEVERLVQKYQLPEPLGLLAVYGPESNETTQFIKAEDLVENATGPDKDKSYVFKGENALLDALTYLTAGKVRATVYFTQGSGELDLEDRDRAHFDMGLGVVQDELTKINYQIRPLPLSPKTTSIPSDADIVVVARPQEQLPANAVKALRDYMNGSGRKDGKKGKMIALFDVNIRKGEMVQTGLESLMAEFGVQVSPDRVFAARRNPLQLTAVTNPQSNNPIARAFISRGRWTAVFPFYDARTVSANPANPSGGFTAETLLVTFPQTPVWIEKDLKADPMALVAELMRGDLEKLQGKIANTPLPLAVAVTEGKTPPPVPGHEFMAKDGEPRLLVFGDASWATNNILLQSTPDNFSLFSSSLSWLAGRHDIGERVPTSTRKVYRLKIAPGDDWRLILLPGVLLLFGVVALGFGVWVVRRR